VPTKILISSKLERPALPMRLVARQRLIERLNEGRNGRATLITAPAGYGKTTLALQWLSGAGAAAAWIGLDPADRDPERFVRYLVAALSGFADNGLERTNALLEARDAPPWAHLTETLIAELAEGCEPAVLVLEDCHAIDTPEIYELVGRIVEMLPRPLHLLVLTRVDPPWPLMLWRTRGWLSLLRARDLCFSIPETEQLFAAAGAAALDPASIKLLHGRTEGWVAALRLAQLSISAADDPVARVRALSGTDRQIADYLMDEVLKSRPAEVLEFLAVSALMERFSAPLMDHLLGHDGQSSNARRILAAAERENLFLIALDDRRRWFRWHHLFRDLLLDHLRDLMPPASRARVARDAATWFARSGLVEEALRCWIAAGDLDAAADLVGANLHAAIAEDQSRRLLGKWLDLFPADAMHGRLPLLVADGYMRTARFDHIGLEKCLSEAEELLMDPSREPGTKADHPLRADVEGLWSNLLFWQGDAEGSLERSQRAFDLTPAAGSAPWISASLYRSGSLALCGRFDEAMRHLNEAVAEVGPNSPHVAELFVTQAILNLYALELDACRALSLQMLEFNERVPLPGFWRGYAHHLQGMVAYERNRLDEAEACFRRVEDLRYIVPSRLFQDALLGRALVALANEDDATAESCCRAARAFAIEVGDPTSLRIIGSFELRLACLRGRPRAVNAGPPPADDHQSFWLEIPTVTWAMHLVMHPASRIRASALPFIDEALARMDRHHNRRPAMTLSVLRALALDARGEHEAALDDLAATVRRAQSAGLVRSFLDCGPRVKELLDELSPRAGRGGYVESLRAAFAGAATPRVPMDPRRVGPSELLSARELETLRLLAWRMTNKEIAARLSVSPAAIKKRLESIYGKLDAHNRREAVAKAVSSGLIVPPAR
jgi:LuxR family maltose regulon positive regulatory protein